MNKTRKRRKRRQKRRAKCTFFYSVCTPRGRPVAGYGESTGWQWSDNEVVSKWFRSSNEKGSRKKHD